VDWIGLARQIGIGGRLIYLWSKDGMSSVSVLGMGIGYVYIGIVGICRMVRWEGIGLDRARANYRE